MPVDPEIIRASYADIPIMGAYVWGEWRPAKLDELVKTWPLRAGVKMDREIWWQPTLDELRVARKAAAKKERRRSSVGD